MVREFNRIFGLFAITGLFTVVFASTATAQPPESDPSFRGGRTCSMKTIAGAWVYATEVGELKGPDNTLMGKLTSLGTFNIDRDGTLWGEFDTTMSLVGGPTIVNHDAEYLGAVTVKPNCRGTFYFAESGGDALEGSLVISGDGSEIRGMTTTPEILWTFTAKRVPKNWMWWR